MKERCLMEILMLENIKEYIAKKHTTNEIKLIYKI